MKAKKVLGLVASAILLLLLLVYLALCQFVSLYGAAAHAVEDVGNGIWKVDPLTLHANKLCDSIHGKLFDADGTLLLSDGETLYCISTDDGTFTRVKP